MQTPGKTAGAQEMMYSSGANGMDAINNHHNRVDMEMRQLACSDFVKSEPETIAQYKASPEPSYKMTQ